MDPAGDGHWHRVRSDGETRSLLSRRGMDPIPHASSPLANRVRGLASFCHGCLRPGEPRDGCVRLVTRRLWSSDAGGWTGAQAGLAPALLRAIRHWARQRPRQSVVTQMGRDGQEVGMRRGIERRSRLGRETPFQLHRPSWGYVATATPAFMPLRSRVAMTGPARASRH